MKVLVVSYLFPNALYPNRGVFVLNRLRAVGRHGEIKVINPIPWFPFSSRFREYRNYSQIPRREILNGIEVYHPRFFALPVVLKGLVAITYVLAILPRVVRMRREWRFDIVSLEWTYPDLPAGCFLARLFGVPQTLTVRGSAAFHLSDLGLRRRIVNWLLPNSDRIIALSSRLADRCVSLGAAPEHVSVVRNGVDVERFRPLDRRLCREKVGVSSNETLILAIGYVTPNKAFDRLIEALPTLGSSTRLYLIGPDGAFAQGDQTAELMALADRLGVRDRVHLVGEVPNQDLPLWYSAADLFCLSSKDEGTPNVLCEALASGCPAVATDVGSVRDVLADPEMGLVVPNSSAGVRDGLASCLARQFDRARIAAAMARYDWAWCGDQVVDVYRRALAERRQRPSENAAAHQRLGA